MEENSDIVKIDKWYIDKDANPVKIVRKEDDLYWCDTVEGLSVYTPWEVKLFKEIGPKEHAASLRKSIRWLEQALAQTPPKGTTREPSSVSERRHLRDEVIARGFFLF